MSTQHSSSEDTRTSYERFVDDERYRDQVFWANDNGHRHNHQTWEGNKMILRCACGDWYFKT